MMDWTLGQRVTVTHSSHKLNKHFINFVDKILFK